MGILLLPPSPPTLQGLANSSIEKSYNHIASYDNNLKNSLTYCKRKFNYKNPTIEKCCANCAFSTIDGNDSWGCKECKYIERHTTQLFSYVTNAEVNDYGVCDHFFSITSAKLLRECASPEELDMKLSIFNIQLDDLLITEFKDGFKQCEQATSKMMAFTKKIIDTFISHDIDIDAPYQICLNEIDKSGKITGASISLSTSFSRINAFLKQSSELFKHINGKMKEDNLKHSVSTNYETDYETDYDSIAPLLAFE